MNEEQVLEVLGEMVRLGHLSSRHVHRTGPKQGLWYVGDQAPAASWDYALGYATAAKALLDRK
jgi:hypothetical protein